MSTDGQPYEAMWREWTESFLADSIDHVKRASKLPGLAAKAQKVRKGVTPSEVVYTEDRVKLLHYKSDSPPRHKTPLIFVFALVNRPYILDLKEGRSVVSHFVESGFDTYLIDWGAPSDADRHLTLDDHINGYLAHIIDEVCASTGADQVNILGYCMGGTMSAAYTALHPERVRNLILLAAGIDFSTREGLLNLWADPAYFDVDGFVDAFGNCPPEFLQASFLSLKPVQNLIEKPLTLWEKIDDDAFIEDFLTMETWLNDNIAVPGEVYRQFVKDLYQKNLLVKNEMKIGRRKVNLKNITCPVLNLMAQYDDLVPVSQSAPFNDLVGSSDRRSITCPAGHIGLAIGSRAQREVWPETCSWLGDRSG
jgi:polyhydroxyalkanoate synthase